MMTGKVVGEAVSVRTGKVLAHERPVWDQVRSHAWATAFWKDEAPGPVRIATLGLDGDEQADRRHHGGPEMAVLMYAESHYKTWKTLAGLERMGPGGFGENLTVRGLDETQVCAGDVLEVGSARLQISSPRGPCVDISRRWNAEWLLKQVTEQRRTGWYLRVLREGEVTTGDDVTLLERPHPGWSVDRLLALRYVTPRASGELKQAAALSALAAPWRAKFAELPARDQVASRVPARARRPGSA